MEVINRTSSRALVLTTSGEHVPQIIAALGGPGSEVDARWARSADEFLKQVQDTVWDMAVAVEDELPGLTVRQVADALRRSSPSAPLIILGAGPDLAKAVAAVKQGAANYLPTDELHRLGSLVKEEILSVPAQMPLAEQWDDGQLREVFDLQFQFMAVLSTEGRILDVNDLPLKVNEVTKGEVLGIYFWEAPWWKNLTDSAQFWRERLELAAQSDHPILGDLKFVDGTGEIREAVNTVTAVRRSSGEVKYFIVQGVDITERKRAEAELAELYNLLRIAGETARLGGWTVSFPGPVIRWTDEVCAIHELPPGTVISPQAAWDFYAPEYQERVAAIFEACRQEGVPIDEELQIVTASGCRIWVRLIGKPVRDAAGQITEIHGALQDITERKQAQAEVARIASLLTHSLDSLTDPFFTVDKEWGITFLNAACQEAVRRPRHEVYGASLWEAFPNLVGSPFERHYRLALETGKAESFREFYEPHQAWFEAHAYPMEDGLAVSFRNVTAVHKSEEQLRLLEACVATIHDIVIVTEAEPLNEPGPRIVFVNDAFVRRTGYSQEEVLGKSPRFLQGPATSRSVLDVMRAALDRREAVREELINYTKAGEEFWLEVDVVPMKDEQGDIRFLVAVEREITERKLAQEALRLSGERLKLVADATNDAIWDWDVDNDVLWWSEGFMRLFGYTRDELEQGIASWINRVHPEDREEVVRTLYQAAATGKGFWVEEYRFFRKDGTIAYVLDRGRVIRDPHTHAVRMVGGMTDLSAYRKTEIALARSNRALKMLTGCNEVLGRAVTEKELISEVCRIAVEIGGYRMAWVGYARNDAERLIDPMAHAGEELGYLSEITLSWSDTDPRGAGPGGQAIRTGKAVAAENIEEGVPTFYWTDAAARRGYRSVICLPLKKGEQIFGLLALYSGETLRFAPEEINLLQDLADDLAFGIDHLRTQSERRRMEQAVVHVAASISANTGTEFFVHLAEHMAEAFGANAGIVSRLLFDEPASARTLAAVLAGQVVQNFTFPIAGTHLDLAAGQEDWVVTGSAAALDPACPFLGGFEVQASVGCLLKDAAGRATGLLQVLFQEPLENPEFILATLKIFAARAASELERKESYRRIREQASLLDKAQDAILVRDLEHKILYWNKSAERLYGWTTLEALGRNVRELLYDSHSEQLDAATEATVKSGEWLGELNQVGKDGRKLVVEGRWTLVRDEKGNPAQILAINTDITERRKIEQQFLRAQRMESIGTLAGGIAHDLNNVLSPITMAVDLLRLKVSDPNNRELLATIADSARRGANMVKQVLSFARGMEGERIKVQVTHIVKDVEKILRDTFPKNLVLRTVISPCLPLVYGDPTQIHQVLLNLCVNSRDAMPDGGKITISARHMMVTEKDLTLPKEVEAGLYLVLEVADTGAGIPAAVIDKVFEPFFTTKEIGKGTGLGLSTSLAIVKSHNGFMRVESEPGEGTKFWVYLPASVDQEITPSSPEESELPRGQGELILVVDDEDLIRLITRQSLEAYGYRVVLAANGAEALRIYAEQGADIAAVLTDMMMPVMDGATTIRALMEMNPEINIIAASGISTNEQLARVSGAGVKSFLPKPYPIEKLLTTLQAMMERPRAMLARAS